MELINLEEVPWQSKTAGGSPLACSFVRQLLGTAADLHHKHFTSVRQSASVECAALHASSSSAIENLTAIANTTTVHVKDLMSPDLLGSNDRTNKQDKSTLTNLSKNG
jgi:hypothetical protein